jgi:diguanylate cyclase (GGDEF)-like protein
VNDGYGQSAGDELLRLVGDRLLGTVREGDTVARLGADSFAILATDLAHPDDTLTVARKIQAVMRKPFVLNAREVRLTVSIGASIYPRDGTDCETMLRNADAAMHQVKSEGQDGFRFYAANMTSDAADRVDLETDLRAALDRNELHLHYQPQVLLASGRVVGVEALMRWTHPKRGQVPPGVFIPVAEHSDFIHTLGEWAFSEACRQLKQWRDRGFALRMAVNVSARQFRSASFTDILKRAIEKTGVEPGDIALELTESVLVDDPMEAKQTLDGLKELGVRVAVDDFGTGYSSLNYLSRLPIDCLKIDRTFLQRIPGERQDTAIVQAIISLAASLELDVIAEGIETEQQLAFLREHQCAEGQGYYFAKPAPPSEVESFLRGQ